jgi:hypothetical protein
MVVMMMMMMTMNNDWRGFGLDGCWNRKPANSECEVEDTSLLDY